MKTKVQKWGNSLALRIPKSFVLETDLKPDAEVDLSLVEGKLIITPLAKTAYSLDTLLKDITEDNTHAEIITGAPVGNEVW
jgi:antitoxin MazE